MTDFVEVAQTFLGKGFSVIPTGANKRCTLKEWGPYQDRLMTIDEAKLHFSKADRLAVIGGKISENLECLDFDDPAVYPLFIELLTEQDPALAAILVKRKTPRGGFHLYYRCTEPVAGNLKLASDQAGAVRIETRGEGGYFLTTPSPGYSIIEHSILDTPTITPAQVAMIHALARMFDQRSQRAEQAPLAGKDNTSTPGTDYNKRHTVADTLALYGWKEDRRTTAGTGWTRPGKDNGTSGVLLESSGNFYCWSSNASPLDPGKSYGSFAIYAAYEHNGDYQAAARTLGNQGYGIPTSLKPDVTNVTGVTANNGGACERNANEKPDVTDVTVPEHDRPCFRVIDDWAKLSSNVKMRPGVWSFGIKAGKDGKKDLTPHWICSPIHVEAVTFDEQENNFGRLLRIKNTIGRWRTWAMPMELLSGDGNDLRRELLAMGVEIDPKAKNDLANYIQLQHPKRHVHCALQVGWNGDSYVLPDAVIGEKAADVIFQSGERGHDEHTTGGTLAGWQEGIAALAVGNPFLTLAVSASFAGPLLARTNSESGGVHWQGDSSTGKTTLLDVACSTWGGPNFKRSWRTTSNGMEGAAALFNDCLLALDEISECDPREVGAIVYSLGNGRGKQRASRTGAARSVTRWRCFVLSSGERTIGTTMAEGGHRVKAGQSVRLLDIPAARKYGAFDDLHGESSGSAFSDTLKLAAVTHYGHAGRAFLEKLTRDPRNFCELLERVKSLSGFSPKDGEGQEKRAAGRFALMALAGELATEYSLTGWTEGAAVEAAEIGFNAWRSLRGRGNDERRQIVEKLLGFIERHGDSRFSDASNGHADDSRVINRAGWYRNEDGHRAYLFTADGMKEATQGFELKRALDVLQEVGVLIDPGTNGERARSMRLGERIVKVYTINAERLGGDDHGA